MIVSDDRSSEKNVILHNSAYDVTYTKGIIHWLTSVYTKP